MAMNMTAAVNIKASVDGLQSIAGLQKGLAGVDAQAKKTNQTFGGLRQAAGGALSGLTGLVPGATVAGLAVLGKRSIDAADNLRDLSQRTGVGVESLSRFGAAAQDSGSNIDEVAKAMGRLAKGIADPASQVNESLRSIGVNSRDARGNIRGVDAIMLDLADKFAKLPDGAQKTALAMNIFGKSGANLIPMLNQGRDALEKYRATISTDMANAADQFNDTLNELGRSLAGPFNQAIVALLPSLTQFAQVIADIAQAFAQLPQPIQTVVIAVGGLAIAFNLLSGSIGVVVRGFQLIAGLNIAGTIAGWAPVIVQIGAVLLNLGRILLGIFTGPVGWVTLLVSAGIALYAFRDNVAQVFQGLGTLIGAAFNGISAIFANAINGFNSIFVQPLTQLSQSVVQGISNAFKQLGNFITAPFRTALDLVRGVMRNLLNFIASGINRAIGAVNALIGAYNRLPAPNIPYVSGVSVPAFANGGTVNKPTLALVGEGGQREYIIPESRMAQASTNYLAGSRGNAVLNDQNRSGSGLSIQIQTGPVLQQNGQNWVSVRDMEQALNTLADSLLSNNRTPGGRRYQGVAA